MAAPLALGVMGAGALIGAYGQYKRGKLARTMGRLQKKEYEATAKQSVAASQRVALEEKRTAELLASRAIAVAAAGGGSTDDSTVTKIIADIHGEGAYRSALAMYEGEEQARKLRFEGAMAEFLGEKEYEASKTSAISSLLGSGGSMFAAAK